MTAVARQMVDDGWDDLAGDSVLGGRLTVRQGTAAHRISTDTILLAASVVAQAGDEVLEIGSGTGGAALCVAYRVPGCSVMGLERERDLVALANANAEGNGLADRARFVTGDVTAPPHELLACRFDHVFANPPYLETERSEPRAGATKRAARIEGAGGLVTWIDLMLTLVKAKGRLTLIQRADRLGDVLCGLAGRAGEVVVCPLWPKAGVPARRVIVSARRGVATPMKVSSGLVLHQADGTYQPDVDRILRHGAGLDL